MLNIESSATSRVDERRDWNEAKIRSLLSRLIPKARDVVGEKGRGGGDILVWLPREKDRKGSERHGRRQSSVGNWRLAVGD